MEGSEERDVTRLGCSRRPLAAVVEDRPSQLNELEQHYPLCPPGRGSFQGQSGGQEFPLDSPRPEPPWTHTASATTRTALNPLLGCESTALFLEVAFH